MPRSALDPVALGPILTNVLLIEVAETAQQDYLPMMRFRVIGDEIRSRYGRSCGVRLCMNLSWYGGPTLRISGRRS